MIFGLGDQQATRVSATLIDGTEMVRTGAISNQTIYF
jgi:hypothetical protein